MNEDIIEINDTRDPFILLIAKLDYFVWIKRIISVFKERLRDYVAVSSKIFSLCASILLKKEKKKKELYFSREEKSNKILILFIRIFQSSPTPKFHRALLKINSRRKSIRDSYLGSTDTSKETMNSTNNVFNR